MEKPHGGYQFKSFKTEKIEPAGKRVYKYSQDGEFISSESRYTLKTQGFNDKDIDQIQVAAKRATGISKGFQWREYKVDDIGQITKQLKRKSEVYIYTNIITDEKYVGQTNFGTVSRAGKNGKGYKDCPKFYAAIQKYGWSTFRKEIVGKELDSDAADLLEQHYIKKYDTINNGYNIQSGGANRYKKEDYM